MLTGEEFADQAMSERYTGIPYSKLDCQAFVEEVLKDCGVRKPDGSVYNWKGSNSMWRTALSWKGTIQQCKDQFGDIPLGAWTFILRNDGGEKEKGYTDNQGNASHVGIYCKHDNPEVRDSTKTAKRDGVGYRNLSGFTHIGLCKLIDYSIPEIPNTDAVSSIKILRNPDSSDTDFLKALETLTKYLKGV